MRIDGRIVSQQILNTLRTQISAQGKRRIIPTLGVVLVGSDPGSLSYIRQKQRAADSIGARIRLVSLPADTPTAMVRSAIETCDSERTVHGIILQRPLPEHLRSENVGSVIRPEKDIDGFLPHSPFDPPVSLAVLLLIKSAWAGERGISDGEGLQDFTKLISNTHDKEVLLWLRSKSIVIIGRGETAGKPIALTLARRYFATDGENVATMTPDFTMEQWQHRNNQHCATSIVHSKTPGASAILRNADINISCTGNKGMVTNNAIKPGVILVGVGIWRDAEGKLHGDYEEKDIDGIASFYTPTPGGVGPVNVACLMGNLVFAAQKAR